MYPRALRSIVDGGHEVAVHAWRHEEWAALDGESEVALLARATNAMRSIGIEPRGFRPPGGGLTKRTPQLLGEHGYSYVSPAGERRGCSRVLAVLPFRWPLVDAYAYLPTFAGLRERYGDGPDPIPPRADASADDRRPGEPCRARGSPGAAVPSACPSPFTGDPGWEALDSVLGETVRLAETGAHPQ